MDNWGWHHGFAGGGLLMGLFWLIVVLLVYGLVRTSATRNGAARTPPQQVLQDRCARGEIGRDEYLEKLRDLED